MNYFSSLPLFVLFNLGPWIYVINWIYSVLVTQTHGMHSLSYSLWAPKDVIVAFSKFAYDHQKFHHHIVDMNQLHNYLSASNMIYMC